ncbi:MAG TPA: metallophosphoesterase family protein [Polyangiaceae bacterium]|nr:metallophosphoesterase family protein [Polyangiaceae bacterium]
MKLAVMGDIHSNYAALRATLTAIEADAVDVILCLGDLVGYNAEPKECLALIRARVPWVVRGNHDEDVCGDDVLLGTGRAARVVQRWTRQLLDASELAQLENLPNYILQRDKFIAVHGCFLNDKHTYGYVTESMLGENLERIAARTDWPKLAFCAHTHVPLLGWLDGDHVVRADLESRVVYPPQARATLLNPGSVGQPRDGDTRASYALVDIAARSVQIRRVSYDIEQTIRKNQQVGLAAEFSERLREGR